MVSLEVVEKIIGYLIVETYLYIGDQLRRQQKISFGFKCIIFDSTKICCALINLFYRFTIIPHNDHNGKSNARAGVSAIIIEEEERLNALRVSCN